MRSVRPEGSRRHLSPRTRQAACLARRASPYLRRIQPGSPAPWPGPESRLSPSTPRAPARGWLSRPLLSGLRASSRVGVATGWRLLEKRFPGVQLAGPPLAPRAPPRQLQAPRGGGTERNQSVSETRTHPALPVPPPSLIGWTRLEGVASGAEGGGSSGLSRQRLCFSGPPARRRERALRWAHCALESGTSRPQGPKGGAPSASTLGPPRCLDATPLLSLIVLACVQEDTVARAHVERRDSPKAYYGLGLC